MKKNKLLFVLSTSLISVSVLAGCNKGGGKIELKIGFWPEATETKDIAMYNDWKAAFEADYPQYEIVGDPYEYSLDTIFTKYNMGTLPDVFQTWFTEPLKLSQNGIIRDVTKQLTDLDWLSKMDDGMRDTLTFDGKIYGVPRDGYGLGLLLNKKTLADLDLLPTIDGKPSIFDKDGNPVYPTTFEQIHEWGETITEWSDTKAIYILASNKQGGWQFNNMVWNYGDEFQKQEGGKWKSNLNSKAAVDALTWIQTMMQDEYLLNGTSGVYDDWPTLIGEKVAMAIVGSDVLQNATLKADVPMEDLAFVPMPTGDGTHHYSLYGGTPFVFNSRTSDEKVEGILKFFEYIGRAPSNSAICKSAIEKGYEVAKSKNQPILPKIMPWKNKEYLDMAKELENKYVNVDMKDFNPFFDTIQQYKKTEEPNCTQQMYECLDTAIKSVLDNPDTANPDALLTTANSKFQTILDNEVNK